MAVNASSSSDELITAVSGSFTPSDAQAFALEYLKSHSSGNTPLQKLRLFQNIAIAEAVVEVRSQEKEPLIKRLPPLSFLLLDAKLYALTIPTAL